MTTWLKATKTMKPKPMEEVLVKFDKDDSCMLAVSGYTLVGRDQDKKLYWIDRDHKWHATTGTKWMRIPKED